MLIPILLVILYLVKNFYFAIPIFLVGIILQILLYQEHKKKETHKQFLKEKSGAALVGVLLLGYFFVKNTFF
jgi:formate-dependent nitrite reductase membrane component NrfD